MKVLLITHNPISTYTNIGKTLDSLFSSFKREELCQLYTYSSLPDNDKCCSYYQLSDLDVLKGFLRKTKGRVLLKEQIKTDNSTFETDGARRAYKLGKNKTPAKMLLRDLMWACLGWKSEQLYKWITEQKPTHIVVLPGRFKFIYRISLKISKDFDLPIVSYICDDFYFVKTPTGILERLYLSQLRKQIEELLSNTRLLVTICEELTTAFKKIVDVNALTIMTGTNYSIVDKPKEYSEIKVIRYFGNIGYERYQSLYDIGLAIDEINKQQKTDIKLEIYSGEDIHEAQLLFAKTKSIVFKGFIKGNDFLDLFDNSPMVLHVESFNLHYIDVVKHSVSTKIADSLSSGNLLVAYGPDSVSSMKHLMKNKYVAVATNYDGLLNMLSVMLFHENERKRCVLDGLNIAKKYHDSERSSRYFYDCIKEELNEGYPN